MPLRDTRCMLKGQRTGPRAPNAALSAAVVYPPCHEGAS
jgi:hypothetical protein